ncbi:MAG: patatin-like phospholipase family protein [Cyclobacteriaceae bacterium]
MKVGVALSGGGARGLAHLGVLKAIKERGFEVSIVSGTSSGALVGAFFCHGYDPEEAFRIITETSIRKWLRPAYSRSGFLNIEAALKHLQLFFKDDTFESLKIPLVASATNLQAGTTTFFDTGKLSIAILASSAVPVVFRPVKIENTFYVDGGILNNLPIEPLQGKCDKIIGVNSNPIGEFNASNNFRSVLERSLLMTINVNAYAKKPLCDLFIEPPGLRGVGVFQLKRAKHIFDAGYRSASELLDSLATDWK